MSDSDDNFEAIGLTERKMSYTQQSREEETDHWVPQARPKHGTLKWKTAATAYFLLFCGVLFGSIGLWRVLEFGLTDATPFLTIAGLTFIPGAYHVHVIIRTYLRHPGWSYDTIPAYD